MQFKKVAKRTVDILLIFTNVFGVLALIALLYYSLGFWVQGYSQIPSTEVPARLFSISLLACIIHSCMHFIIIMVNTVIMICNQWRK